MSHAVFLRAMDHYESVLLPQIVADKNEFIKAAAARYADHGTPNFFDLVDKHQQQLFKTLSAHYRKVIPAFGLMAIAAIKTKQMKAAEEDSLFLRLSSEWVHREGLKRSKMIADTTEADVLAAVDYGMQHFFGIAAIASDIADLTDLSPWRSELIARTETHAAANYASIETVRDAEKQLGVTMLKQWSPTLDDRTRPAHADMEGSDPIPMDDMFIVDGEELDRPGDPNGSPENVINCRCLCLFTETTE